MEIILFLKKGKRAVNIIKEIKNKKSKKYVSNEASAIQTSRLYSFISWFAQYLKIQIW